MSVGVQHELLQIKIFTGFLKLFHVQETFKIYFHLVFYKVPDPVVQ